MIGGVGIKTAPESGNEGEKKYLWPKIDVDDEYQIF